MSMTDTAMMERIQYVMLEPPDLGVTWPSGLWSEDEVRGYLNQRQNRFLKTSLLLVGVANTDPISARQSIVPLPEDWIATVSVVWHGDSGIIRELVRSDAFAADHGIPQWPTEEATPQVYLDYAQPTLQLQIAPIPDEPGFLEVLYVSLAATFVAGTPDIFTLPDEFVDAAGKYGPLADMWAKDGRGRNPEKAAYCEGRFQLGLDAAALILRGAI